MTVRRKPAPPRTGPFSGPGKTNPNDPSHGHEPGGVVGPKRTPSDALAGLTGDQRNAYRALQALFASFGLETLAPKILDFVKQGYDQSTTQLLLEDTKEWKDRFAGNELLKKRGLGEYQPGEYLQLENSYAQALAPLGAAGKMFGRADFAEWIGNSVSSSEIHDRVQMAAAVHDNTDPFFRSSLEQFGIDTGHQIAYFLDDKRALPYLQRKFQAAQIGGSALRHDLNLDTNLADQLAGLGVSASQAEGTYTTIAQNLDPMKKLAALNGQSFTQSDFEKALFLGDANEIARSHALQMAEASRFAGSGGAERTSNNRSLQGAY